MIMGVYQSTGAGLGVPSAADGDASLQLRCHARYAPIILYLNQAYNPISRNALRQTML